MSLIPLQPAPTPSEPSDRPHSGFLTTLGHGMGRLLTHWGLWVSIIALIPLGIGVWAVKNLFELSAAADCSSFSQSEDASTNRLYCAEMIASRQTTEDWLKAIALVNAIDSDHPLATKRDRLVRVWTEAILQQADADFQAGDLDAAIKTARRIPLEQQTQPIIRDRIAQWQSTWEQAEEIYRDAESAIERKAWYDTLTTAKRLLTLGNHHWQTTKYQELMQSLQSAKENEAEQAKLRRNQAKPVEDLLTRWQRQHQLNAAERLTKARNLGRSGRLSELKAAVSEAEQIFFDTPQYEEAQTLISTWKSQIETLEDQPRLQQALELARKGDEASLQQAIDEANQIFYGRALYQEANHRVEEWTEQLYRLRAATQMQQLPGLSELPAPTHTPQPVINPSIDSATRNASPDTLQKRAQ